MRLIAGILLVTLASGASAQLYRWTDASGRVHYTDSPPPAGAKSTQKKGQLSTAPPAEQRSPSQGSNEPYALQLARKNGPVTLYTGPDCEPCQSARTLLNARGIPFKEVLVRDERTAAELKVASGGGIVPAIVVGSSRQQGYEEATYHALLDAAGYPKKGILPARKQVAPTPPVTREVKAVSEVADPLETLPPTQKGPYLPR